MGAWQDRFQPPTADMLLSELPDGLKPALRVAIRDLGGRPKAVWVDSWNWTLHLQTPQGPVYFIPDPSGPRLAVRLPRHRFERMHEALKADRASKSVLLSASGVGDTVWTEWAVDDPETLAAVAGALKNAESV